jgi:hypothetical protein
MTDKKVVHQIKLDRSVKALLWGFVAAIALNAVPDGYLIEDAMAQLGNYDTLRLNVTHSGSIGN